MLPLAEVETELTPGRELVIAGYGFSETTSEVLHVARTPFVRRSSHEMLVGGALEPDVCSGDSGGPSYVETATGTYLVGVTSRGRADRMGTGECGEGFIAALAPAYDDWILSVLREGPDAGSAPADAGVRAASPPASCGCAVPSTRSPAAPGVVLALVGATVARAVRRGGRRGRRGAVS